MAQRFAVLVGTVLLLAASVLPDPAALDAPAPAGPATSPGGVPHAADAGRTASPAGPPAGTPAGTPSISTDHPPNPQHRFLPGGSVPQAAIDLRRPRLAAGGAPDLPHPAPRHHREPEPVAPKPELHLVRQTKDRGS